ncbi:hypothetical protein N6H13_09005 [Paenibacillus sp. CC-CFT742]|nr:hypothetical protein [Paenibacillus sp. CC-CFT742]WJH30741.1 hypothetical protein N6H13_09005 [Paenibacillus sp. CC-CFT742]
MSYLVEWSRRRNKALPEALILEGLERLNPYITAGNMRIGRQVFDPQGPWNGDTFPLLEELSRMGDVSPYLTSQLERVIEVQPLLE